MKQQSNHSCSHLGIKQNHQNPDTWPSRPGANLSQSLNPFKIVLEHTKHQKNIQGSKCWWYQCHDQSVLVLVCASKWMCKMHWHVCALQRVDWGERKSGWFSVVIHPKFAGSPMCCCGSTGPTTRWKAQKATWWWWWCCSGRAQGQSEG